MRSWQLEWFGPLRRLPGPAAQLAGGLLTLARPAPSLGQKSAQQPADHCWPSICIRRPGVDLGGAKTGGRLFLPKTLAPFISFLSLSSNYRAAAGHGGQRSGGAAASSSRRRWELRSLVPFFTFFHPFSPFFSLVQGAPSGARPLGTRPRKVRAAHGVQGWRWRHRRRSPCRRACSPSAEHASVKRTGRRCPEPRDRGCDWIPVSGGPSCLFRAASLDGRRWCERVSSVTLCLASRVTVILLFFRFESNRNILFLCSLIRDRILSFGLYFFRFVSESKPSQSTH